MGTNYYLKEPDTNVCDCCRHSDPGRELHIGKSSAGWVFSLHIYPELGINDLENWVYWWTKGTITNEYGETLSPGEMMHIIQNRGPDARRTSFAHKHGEGSWDCLIGEFS